MKHADMPNGIFEQETGHTYWLANVPFTPLGGEEHGNFQSIVFLKRSSKMITHLSEHGGTNTQNVIRALIRRSIYLNGVQECPETLDAIQYLRMALYSYELRAWRRKQDKMNRQAGLHESISSDRSPADEPDCPFTENEIEELVTDPVDGHIMLPPQLAVRRDV